MKQMFLTLPDNLNTALKIFRLKTWLKDKQEAIIVILAEKLNIKCKEET